MDILSIPFNRLIGLNVSDLSEYFLMLPASEKFLNHLGTVHASALFALAEATSGEALLREFGARDGLASVVRKVETKYRTPAQGSVYSLAALTEDKILLVNELDESGRVFAHVAVRLFDSAAKLVASFEFEWFVTKIQK